MSLQANPDCQHPGEATCKCKDVGLAEGMWWCAAHGREATYVDKKGRHCCDPKLGGLLLPCSVELIPENKPKSERQKKYD